ncbi:GTPase-associated system all-helical protein GASH [Vibrio sp. 811]|uniref:GTPase-associated system all-helical protein GASH n=1 Tax=Vibrio sp. 811 TaxID=3074616 RepID=UPI0029645DD8|nr:GTPase-associated system all-helical protein GASH [Vibrio sp. 811]MDW1986917.1 GTPase-associated system all-helical protein GASH [Vibrio sp. 811]
MDTILDSFLGLGLIESIDGNDERYAKIEQAAQKLAEYYREERDQLIPAILCGLNPNVSLDELPINKAKELLQNEWKAFLTAYTDEPVNLYRSIILEACSLVSEEDNNAAIMWLTACDVFPLLRCGKEENLLRTFLQSLGRTSEQNAIVSAPDLSFSKAKTIKLDELPTPVVNKRDVDENDLRERIGGAANNTYINKDGQNVAGIKPNRYAVNQNPSHWAGDFAERMSEIITSELALIEEQSIANNKAMENVNSLKKSVEKALNEQRLALQRQQKAFLDYQRQEQTRLNVLWWAEALYSTSQKESYRSHFPEIAAVLMPYDLLEEIQLPSPASVVFTLAEAVGKLPECSHDRDYSFYEILTEIRNKRSRLDPFWLETLTSKLDEKNSNIGGMVVRALVDENCDLDSLIEKSFIPQDWRCSLPELSRAIFRQEQAYRLVTEV